MSPRSEAGDAPNYPQPYTRVVDINAGAFTTASEMQVWNDKYVFAYSALAVNSNSEVAIAVAWGGPDDEADAAFGILGDFVVWYRDGSTATTPGTTPGRWGDFLRTHRCVSESGHLGPADQSMIWSRTSESSCGRESNGEAAGRHD